MGTPVTSSRGLKVADKRIEVYTADELRRFFEACDPNERTLFQVSLLTGFRAEEVSSLTWRDIHHSAGKISVSAKPGSASGPSRMKCVPLRFPPLC